MGQPLLTTVPKVKDYLRSPIGEDGERILQDFIEIASGMVRRYTKRWFTSPPVTETRTYRTYGRSFVHVDELMALADVSAITDGDGVTLDYELDFGEDYSPVGVDVSITDPSTLYGVRGLPDDHADNFIRELRYAGTFTTPEAIKVTGTFGYAANKIPREVEFATRRAVAIWFKEEVAHYTDEAFISRGNFIEPDQLPPIVMAMLKSWVVESEVLI